MKAHVLELNLVARHNVIRNVNDHDDCCLDDMIGISYQRWRPRTGV